MTETNYFEVERRFLAQEGPADAAGGDDELLDDGEAESPGEEAGEAESPDGDAKLTVQQRQRKTTIRYEWEVLVPALRAEAESRGATAKQYYEDILWRAWNTIDKLFDALHSHWYNADEKEKPRFFWRHQSFNFFKLNDPTRGFDIDRGELSAAAADYLKSKGARTDRLDWVFLDAIVFAELESLAQVVFEARSPMAAAFANRSEGRYLLLRLVLWLLSFAFNFVVWPGGAIYLFAIDHPIWATIVGGWWVVWLIAMIVTSPKRWRARRKAKRLLEYLIGFYGMLNQETISPRKLKEALDVATADGVVLDGAVFTIIDRMLARDPTAFFPKTR